MVSFKLCLHEDVQESSTNLSFHKAREVFLYHVACGMAANAGANANCTILELGFNDHGAKYIYAPT